MVEFILWTVGVIFVLWLSAYVFFNYFYTLKGGQGGLEDEARIFIEEERSKEVNSPKKTQNKSNRNIEKTIHNEDTDDEDFLTSAFVGAATNSTIIGTAVGGSVVGAMIGDMLIEDESEINEEPKEDTSYEEEDTDWDDDDD